MKTAHQTSDEKNADAGASANHQTTKHEGTTAMNDTTNNVKMIDQTCGQCTGFNFVTGELWFALQTGNCRQFDSAKEAWNAAIAHANATQKGGEQ